MNASPTNTTVTAELACPEWCMTSSLAQRADWDDNLWHICGDSYKHSALIEFGDMLLEQPNGSGYYRESVSIEQYQGGGVLPPGEYDRSNRWRNGLPMASLSLHHVDADTCRAAAAALLEAAALLDRIGEQRLEP